MTTRNVDLLTELGNVLEGGRGDVLREMLSTVLHAVMAAEVEAACGAEYGQRSDGRTNHRNGYRARPFETRVGSMDLQVPKLRKGTYFPSFLEPRRRWEKAFVNVVAEAYVEGVSTRSVEDLIEAMGAKGVSKSEVSRMAAVLDDQVTAFRARPLGERAMPYVWLDAMYVKVRENGRVVSRAVMLAIAVNEDGEREVLGVDVADKEMESSWRTFLRSLVTRGLRGVQLVISDAHEGLRAAIRAVFNGVTWQRCYVHFIRNVLDKTPKSAQGFVAAALRNVFAQTRTTTPARRWARPSTSWRPSGRAQPRSRARPRTTSSPTSPSPAPIGGRSGRRTRLSGSTRRCAVASASWASSPRERACSGSWARCSLHTPLLTR